MGCCSAKPATSEVGTGDVLLVRNDLGAPTRYMTPHAIWVALLTGHVKLLRASYLIKLALERGVLRRRQELPAEAFISAEELERLYGEGNEDGVLPIISISFCWDTAPHPDPRGVQLATVAAALTREMPKYAKLGFTEMGVFWGAPAASEPTCTHCEPLPRPHAEQSSCARQTGRRSTRRTLGSST